MVLNALTRAAFEPLESHFKLLSLRTFVPEVSDSLLWTCVPFTPLLFLWRRSGNCTLSVLYERYTIMLTGHDRSGEIISFMGHSM